MSLKTFHKTGKILFWILFFYCISLYPAMILAFSGCSGNEFCGMWLILVYPLHFIIFEKLEFLPFSDLVFLLITVGVVLFFLLLKFLLKKWKKFDLGYSWALILSFLMLIFLLFISTKTVYKFTDTDWDSWSAEAASSNNPDLCEKTVPLFRTNCLLNAAVLTGNDAFCNAIDPANFEISYSYQLTFQECIAAIQIVKNVSEKFCNTDYDLACVEVYSPDFMKIDMPVFALIANFETLATNTGDTSWCDLMSGTEESNDPMYWCYSETYLGIEKLPERLLACDKITDEEYQSACYNFSYWEMFEKTNDPSWCDKISDDYPFKKDCEEAIE